MGASQASVDEGEVNKTVPYLLGYLAPLTVLGFTLWGSISSRGKVFKGWRQWAIYFAVFFIITAAIVAGSRMYNPVSGVCSEYGDFGKQTWIPFLFAALATVTIIGCGFKDVFFDKSNDGERPVSHGFQNQYSEPLHAPQSHLVRSEAN